MSPEMVQRLWAKVDRSEGCWTWSASILRNGYGQFHAAPLTTLAHRFSYMLHKGPIPADRVIDHLCHNRRCVNPTHLEAVPQSVNLQRGLTLNAAQSRQTKCLRGHEFTAENTYLYRGTRSCRTCRREQMRARRRALAAS